VPDNCDFHTEKKPPEPKGSFAPSKMCANCHDRIYDQQAASMHARSYSNIVFRAQYYGEILPSITNDPAMYNEARHCAACHMPIAYLTTKRKPVTEEDIDHSMSGVTCDLCHRIRDYEGSRPGNGNYIAVPGQEKYGPFLHAKSWHHTYLKLQTKSEFCATCHHRLNSNGLLIQPTYVEWKNSSYARRNIECQDCHMSEYGHLINDEPLYESGKAADMVLGEAPYRPKLYSHHFPGARTATQHDNAIGLRIKLSQATNAAPPTVRIDLDVDNMRTGHNMPSGAIELRSLWLDVYVLEGTNQYAVAPTSQDGKRQYDISGRTDGDGTFTGDTIPPDKRIYRAIFEDAEGSRTDSVVKAKKKVFDNRLEACAVRKELYTWKPPQQMRGPATVVALLYYNAYPDSFSKRLGLPAAENTLISNARGMLVIDETGAITFPLEQTDW